MDQMVLLDQSYVSLSLQRQELKRWWVAEAVGVHKTTLRRWLQGKIARIRVDRVSRLAEVLNEPFERIVQASAVAERSEIGCNNEYAKRTRSLRENPNRNFGKLAGVLPPLAA